MDQILIDTSMKGLDGGGQCGYTALSHQQSQPEYTKTRRAFWKVLGTIQANASAKFSRGFLKENPEICRTLTRECGEMAIVEKWEEHIGK